MFFFLCQKGFHAIYTTYPQYPQGLLLILIKLIIRKIARVERRCDPLTWGQGENPLVRDMGTSYPLKKVLITLFRGEMSEGICPPER
jgi:hypothetical protein